MSWYCQTSRLRWRNFLAIIITEEIPQNILDGKWKRNQQWFLRYKDFYKVSLFFEAWLTMSKTWSGQYWERKLLCFTQESVSFHITYREVIGKDEASDGISKPQNSLKCSERRLRNKVDDLAQYFVHYMYSKPRIFIYLFNHCSSSTNAFENSWASAPLHALCALEEK